MFISRRQSTTCFQVSRASPVALSDCRKAILILASRSNRYSVAAIIAARARRPFGFMRSVYKAVGICSSACSGRHIRVCLCSAALARKASLSGNRGASCYERAILGRVHMEPARRSCNRSDRSAMHNARPSLDIASFPQETSDVPSCVVENVSESILDAERTESRSDALERVPYLRRLMRTYLPPRAPF